MLINFIYSLPNWALAILIVAIVLIYALGGQMLVHRFVPAERRRARNDVTDPVCALIGIVFAVLMAFVAVVVWQQFDTTERNVVLEASATSDLYRQALGYPEPLRSTLRKTVQDYIDTVIKKEWPLQQKGEMSPDAWRVLEAAHRAMLTFEPKTEGEKIVHQEQLKKMSEVMSLRRSRNYATNQGISGQVWAVMIIGTMLMIAVIWFFGTASPRAHLWITGSVGLAIGLVLFLVAALDYPLRGELSVSPEAFEAVQVNIGRLAADEAKDATAKR